MSLLFDDVSHSSLTSLRYDTASRVSERLGEMGKDLTSMIEEINSASTAISKNNKADDPVRITR